MNKSILKRGGAVLGLVLAFSAGPLVSAGVADDDKDAAYGIASDPSRLKMQAVLNQLETRGYTDFIEIEIEEEGFYEVEARDSEGNPVKLILDPRSGKVISEEPND